MPTRSSQHLRFDDVSVERKKLREILRGVCNHFFVFLECTLLPLKNCVYQSNNFFNLNKKKKKKKNKKKNHNLNNIYYYYKFNTYNAHEFISIS